MDLCFTKPGVCVNLSDEAEGSCLSKRFVIPYHMMAGNSKARVDKVPPKMLDYFGWCTWDAFYSTISAEGDTLAIVSRC